MAKIHISLDEPGVPEIAKCRTLRLIMATVPHASMPERRADITDGAGITYHSTMAWFARV
jgi:hypothetical protein